jgi:glycosyltransferase involved in cell wall biosynthesis
MRLLWFSHFIPYPPRGGAYQRSFNLLRSASRSYEVCLVAFNRHGHSSSYLSECCAELSKYCATVTFWEMPARWKSARWWAKLALSAAEGLPYSSSCFWSPEREAEWKIILQQHQGALVHFDSIDLGLFTGAAAGFRKVLNHHNCESAMVERRAERERNPLKKVYLRSQAGKLTRLERATCPLFDVNVVVSELDAQLLNRNCPGAHFHVVENGTDIQYFAPRAGSEERNSLIFTGSLDWYPNIAAIRLFVEKVWPSVKLENPGVRFYVAGRNATVSLLRWLKQDSAITVAANPEDIRPWIARAAVFVCPILDGGGTRLKILDAMAMGKAVVSTSIGCEGLAVKDGENILIADTPEALANVVSEALKNEALRRRLGASGRALAERKYSWGVVGGHLQEAYMCALGFVNCAPAARTIDSVGMGSGGAQCYKV